MKHTVPRSDVWLLFALRALAPLAICFSAALLIHSLNTGDTLNAILGVLAGSFNAVITYIEWFVLTPAPKS